MGIILNRHLPWCIFSLIMICVFECVLSQFSIAFNYSVWLHHMVMGSHYCTFPNYCKYGWREIAHTIFIRCPGVVDRAQVQAFLLGYLSGQLGLVMVPLTLFTTWSQPAARDTNNTWSSTHTSSLILLLIMWATFKLQTLRIVVVFGIAFHNLLKHLFATILFLFSMHCYYFYLCPQEEGVL